MNRRGWMRTSMARRRLLAARGNAGRRGMTLIEIMVAMALMIVLIGMVVYIWNNAMAASTHTMNVLLLHYRGRVVMDTLEDTYANRTPCLPLWAKDESPNYDYLCQVGAYFSKWHLDNTRNEDETPKTKVDTKEYEMRFVGTETGNEWPAGYIDPDSPGKLAMKSKIGKRNQNFGVGGQFMFHGCTFEKATGAGGVLLSPGAGDWQFWQNTGSKGQIDYSKSWTGVWLQTKTHCALWDDDKGVKYGTSIIPGTSTSELQKARNYIFVSITGESFEAARKTGSTKPDFVYQYGYVTYDGQVGWRCEAPYLYFNMLFSDSYGSGSSPDAIMHPHGQWQVDGAEYMTKDYINIRGTSSGQYTRDWQGVSLGGGDYSVRDGGQKAFMPNVSIFEIQTSCEDPTDVDTAMDASVAGLQSVNTIRGKLTSLSLDGVYSGSDAPWSTVGYPGISPTGNEYPRHPRWVKVNFELLIVPTKFVKIPILQRFTYMRMLRP